MFRFSKSSYKKLLTCDIDIIHVCENALAFGIMDFTVIYGYRGELEQNE